MKPLTSRRSVIVATLFGVAWCSTATRAQSPSAPQAAIDGVIAAGAKIEMIKDGFVGGEGPVRSPDGGLYFTDIRTSRIYKLDKDGNVAVWRENTGGSNGLFQANDGRLLAAEMEAKRVVAITPDGSVTPLVTEFGGKPLRAPNDLIMDKKGGIYFTDPARGPGVPGPSHVLYRRPNGQVVLIDDQYSFPNGLTLSLDEKTLYVGDVTAEHVYAYDVQPDGSVKNKRPFAKLQGYTQAATGWRSGADGMAIDSNGRLYVTSDIGVQVFDTRGVHLGTISVPTKARNVAFGGPRRQTLYITGPSELYRVPMLAEGPAERSK